MLFVSSFNTTNMVYKFGINHNYALKIYFRGEIQPSGKTFSISFPFCLCFASDFFLKLNYYMPCIHDISTRDVILHHEVQKPHVDFLYFLS